MPRFELTGPDGARYELEAADENAALAAFQQFSGGAAAPAAEPEKPVAPLTLSDVARPLATGVPVIGGALNKANAATAALFAPVVEPFMTPGSESVNDAPGATAWERFQNRYSKSLEMQNARDKAFAEQRPITDTALKVTGGVAGLLPAVLAAPKLFGAVGTLRQMVKAGVGSGAAISAADAAVRGEDIVPSTAIGGAFGAGAPLVGRAIGAGVRALTPKGDPVPQNIVRVGNVDVPMSGSQMTGDAVQSAEEQALLRGGRGEKAQGIAQDFETLQNARIKAASDEIAAGLDPTGRVAATAPQDAGERVVTEVLDAEMTRLATDNARRARIAAEGEQVRAGVGGQVDAAGNPVIVADSPFAAGEMIGPAVAARRGEHVARTRGLYDDLRAEPGAFEPALVRGMGTDVRTRIAAGDNPVWVDPDTTPQAAKAIRLIDEVDPSMFGNRAAVARAPVGPVAQAAAGPAAPVASEAQQALDELTRQGINPARARAAVADLPGGRELNPSVLEPHAVATPDGRSVQVQPTVVEAASLRTSADAGYDRTLQPRDRSRAASDAQINDIARNLNPSRLGASAEADRGAPIVGGDGMVESGNGRVLALRRAYAENGPAAQRYREWLAQQGVDVGQYREPVLVRERVTPLSQGERRDFAVAANQSATLSLSAPERALADQRLLTPQTLGLIRNPSDLGAADNRDFVRAFMSGMPQGERGAMMNAAGELSSEGLGRIRNAVLARAYGDSPILTRIAESTNDDIKSISNGLVAAAPEWAVLRSGVAAGSIPAELDATGHLIDAVSRTARIRGRGVGLDDSLAQTDAFTQQSPESAAFQRLFYDADGRKAASASQVSNALRFYAQEAAKVDAAPGLNLGIAPVTARDVLATTAQRVGAPRELAREVAEAAAAPVAAAAAEPIGEVGLREMDAARKRLVSMYGDARRAAMGPGGSGSDARAMARILDEFDNTLIEAFEAGRFSGNSQEAQRLLREARASHASYRNIYTSRGGQDEIGKAVEKIVGRYNDTAATPDEIAKLSYGSWSDPGGGKATKVAQRLRGILGPTSPEWGAYKQGLISFLTDTPVGTNPLTPLQRANRIDRYLGGTTGRPHAEVVLSAQERAALRSHAENLRSIEPVPVSELNQVDKAIRKIAGLDGGLPMTSGEVVDLLYSRTGTGAKGLSPKLAEQLKRDLTPDGWTALRQGMWSKLTNAGEGKIEFGPQALSQRLHEFLNESGKPLANVLYSPAERAQMAVLAKTYKQMIPVKGTTNPSGSAAGVAKIFNKASNNLLAMLGGVHSGFGGLALGYGAEKALRFASEAKGARSAVRSFYGDQPRAAVRSSARVPVAITQGAVPILN